MKQKYHLLFANCSTVLFLINCHIYKPFQRGFHWSSLLYTTHTYGGLPKRLREECHFLRQRIVHDAVTRTLEQIAAAVVSLTNDVISIEAESMQELCASVLCKRELRSAFAKEESSCLYT